jgi:hypothetical protein
MSRYTWFEDRSTYVREQLKETRDGTETNKDISASTLKVYFRMMTDRESNVLINLLLTKQLGTSTAGDTGIVDGKPTPTGGHGSVVCRWVLVDEATADTNTISQFQEFVWLEWEDYVKQSPQA